MRTIRVLLLGTLFIVLAPCLGLPDQVAAHERRSVGTWRMEVGWLEEPVYAGLRNWIALELHDASGKPVDDLGDAVKVEVMFGDQRLGPLLLRSAEGQRGVFVAALIPTRPGTYAFRFTGTLRGQKIDETFTCSEQSFDCVISSTEIEFPAADPSRAELAGRLDRMAPRIETSLDQAARGSAAAGQARMLAGGAMAIAILGLVAILVVMRKR